MKKSILLTGALMLMMASCSDEEILLNEEVKNYAEPTLTIIATQGEDASTRIAYNPDGETISLTWTEGDAIYVTDGTDYVELALTDGEGTNKGTFETTEDLPFEEGAQLKAYYKANEWMYDADYGEFCPLMYYDLNQASNGSMDHLKELNYMESEPFEYQSGTISNLRFTQQGAIMKLSLTGLEGKMVKKLVLMSADGSNALLNDFSYGTYYYMDKTILTLGQNGAGIALDNSETLTAYFMLGAMDWGDTKQFKLFAETTGGVYSASLQGNALEAGEFYSLNKEMTAYKFFANGSGTENDPYQIASVDDLQSLSDWINMELSTENIHFKLMNDIDLSSVCGDGVGNWQRIGTDGNMYDANDECIGFKGVFDGNGKTINNLYFEDMDATDVGFFGCVANGGVLKDLHVEGSITADWYSGGVACSNHGTISGCTFSGSVTCEDNGAGGIVGFNRGTIEGCSNAGTIKAGESAEEDSAGGIAGYMNGGSITACYNTGSVSGDYAGGIVGEINFADGTVSITGCYNTGALSGTTYTGGVVGSINESTVSIENCYWSSTDNAEGSGSATTTDCFGSTIDWSAAMNAMNSAISDWEYKVNNDDATKEKEPLKLEEGNHDFIPV